MFKDMILFYIFQLQQSVAPKRADPQGLWRGCRMNHASCNSNQLQFLQGTGLFSQIREL